MDERLKFIARLLDGEKMAVLCRQFGISRKTGYKILTRYNEIGLEGLTDRSRRPYRHANQLPFQIETRIVRLKQDKPSWGAPKIREKLTRLYPDVHTPAILDRHGLVKRRMGRRNRAKGTSSKLSFFPLLPTQKSSTLDYLSITKRLPRVGFATLRTAPQPSTPVALATAASP
jgi:putative transposase